jgi:hypothetical protein
VVFPSNRVSDCADPNVVIRNCDFRENAALEGGTIYVGTDATAVISYCDFRRNFGQNGGAISGHFS